MIKKTILIVMAAFATLTLKAQCSMTNTAISSREIITYNLYFNWQFVWVRVGTASMTTVESVYQGKQAFRSALTTRGSGQADKFFVLRDTLTSYITQDLVPLYYRKGAREGKYYTVDEATYSYPNGQCQVKLHRQKNDGSHERETKTLSNCVFDMLNLFQRARSIDPTGWQKGHEVKVDIVDGIKILPAILRFKGKETVKGDDGNKYECLKLSYIEIKNGKEKEIACFFVTDDKYHIPIRLDINLRFGSAKAFLTSMQKENK